jgi:hypothetical protein
MTQYYNTTTLTQQPHQLQQWQQLQQLLLKRLTATVFRSRIRMNEINEFSFIRDRTYTPSTTTPPQMNQNMYP